MNAAAILPVAGAMLLSYLAGSFPTSIVVGRLFFGKDIRTGGSGNAGGTNAFRVFGWKAGLAVVIVDLGKGLAAALFISRLASGSGLPDDSGKLLCGAAAVAGHVWTVFAGFRGGKGVATAAGALIATAPAATGIAALVFAGVIAATGTVSLGSLSAAAAFPLALAGLGLLGFPPSPWLLGFSLAMVPLIAFTHRANLGRLLRGEEKRFERLMIFRRRRHPEGVLKK
ncbi:MAG: glycerol-3-phosphate 1-O-acyltransferase PlsY [Spirochaetes bacterium]|nr:glycerol-3-phosphate 1-O-acyltransferase PlsY [Spirochaetota bacterium]